MPPEPLAHVDQQAITIRDMPDLLAQVDATLRHGDGFTLYTLNLDHLVKRRQNSAFRALYTRATFVTADGWPIVNLSRPECPDIQRTTGADLVVPLCQVAARVGMPIALFGSSAAILAGAASRLHQICPGLQVVMCEAPAFGFDPNGDAGRQAMARLKASGARICFVALGAPKQEMFSDRAFGSCPNVGFVCIGAALDFIAGAQVRAPQVMQRLRLEWAWRLVLQPRRLGLRYLQCAVLFARLKLETLPRLWKRADLKTLMVRSLRSKRLEPRGRHEAKYRDRVVVRDGLRPPHHEASFLQRRRFGLERGGARSDKSRHDAMSETTRLVLFHTMDPRGNKLGGIETHVRLVLARHPETTSLVFVGIDETGDLTLGEPITLDIETRRVTFLPVAHVPADAINTAAKKVWQSTTLRYALGLLRHLAAIRRAAQGLPASAEIERFEFALVPKLLGLPLVVLVHNEGTSQDKMDSLLKRYWFLHLFNERLSLTLANRIFAVNPAIAARIETLSPKLAAKTEVMSVSVDTQRFVPTPFDRSDEAFHVCFAGRLDAFKDPPLMFATLARLKAQLATNPVGRFKRIVFDYVGASDPSAVPEFKAIEGLTIRHGICAAPAVAAIMRRAHAGIITSFFEGMPCYLLEMMASGRPIGAITLPQFVPLVVPGASGVLVERLDTPEASAEALSDAFVGLARAIEAGTLDPNAIAQRVQSFSVEAQMYRLFACHEGLALGASKRRYRSESIRSA